MWFLLQPSQLFFPLSCKIDYRHTHIILIYSIGFPTITVSTARNLLLHCVVMLTIYIFRILQNHWTLFWTNWTIAFTISPINLLQWNASTLLETLNRLDLCRRQLCFMCSSLTDLQIQIFVREDLTTNPLTISWTSTNVSYATKQQKSHRQTSSSSLCVQDDSIKTTIFWSPFWMSDMIMEHFCHAISSRYPGYKKLCRILGLPVSLPVVNMWW